MKIRNPKSEIRCAEAGAAAGGRPDFRVLKWIRILVGLVLFSVAVTGRAQESLTNRPFHAGFSSVMLQQFNENDAKAAIKVWVEAFVREGAFQADSSAKVFDNIGEMAAEIQRQDVDGVTMPVKELFEIKDRVKFDRYIFECNNGNIEDDYVLLVHQNSPFVRIEDLQGHPLYILHQHRMSLAVPWLDVLLMEKGLKPASGFFGQMNEANKLTQTVLPVFFRQADACLVTRAGFETMGELNPQVSQQLRVLASSPPLVSTGFFLRSGFPKAEQDKLMNAIVRIHTSVAGQQVLTVFQSERLEERPPSILDGTFVLLERHRQLMNGTNSIQPSPASQAQSSRMEARNK